MGITPGGPPASETLAGKAATVNRMLTLYVLKTSPMFPFISSTYIIALELVSSYVHVIAQWKCLNEEHSMVQLLLLRAILGIPADLDGLLVHGRDEAMLRENLNRVGR